MPSNSSIFKIIVRQVSKKPPGISKTNSSSTGSAGVNVTVAGLSNKCVKNTTQPVGPGAAPNAVYKVSEYFCYNRFSYMEAELEMAKYRCKQPSALKK